MKLIQKLRISVIAFALLLGLGVYASTSDMSIKKENLSAYSKWSGMQKMISSNR